MPGAPGEIRHLLVFSTFAVRLVTALAELLIERVPSSLLDFLGRNSVTETEAENGQHGGQNNGTTESGMILRNNGNKCEEEKEKGGDYVHQCSLLMRERRMPRGGLAARQTFADASITENGKDEKKRAQSGSEKSL